MFNKENFSRILREINSTYSSMTEFAQKASFDRTYISKYINMKLSNPPTPKILEKLANSSNGVVSYAELMYLCGYYDRNYSLINSIEKDVLAEYKDRLDNFKFEPSQDIEFHNIISSFSIANSNRFKERITTFCEEFLDRKTEMYELIVDILSSICSKYEEHVKIMGKHMGLTDKAIENEIKIAINSIDNKTEQLYMTPVYGKISAGQPNWAEECLEGYLPIDPNLIGIVAPEEHFFLRVNGESMNKVIRNGAYALIHKQDIVENGEIAVVLVNGDEATLKKFSKQGDLVILEPMSDDTSFQVQVYNNSTPINILGKYVGKFEINK